MKKPENTVGISWFAALKRSDAQAVDYLVDKIRPLVINNLCQQGADKAEAEDIFMDVIVDIFRKVRSREDSFFMDDKFEGYFIKACQWQWQKKYHKNKKHIRVTDAMFEVLTSGQDIEQDLIEIEQVELFWRVFHRLGKSCQKILRLFYWEEKSHQEIARLTGLSYQYAKKKKYKCYQKLIEMIKKDPLFNELTDP